MLVLIASVGEMPPHAVEDADARQAREILRLADDRLWRGERNPPELGR